jgi:hypothetical protein
MKSISKTEALSVRDLHYYRARLKNEVYQGVLERFYALAQQQGLTKKQMATLLGRDAGQLNRQLAEPANWTLDTVSDLLLAMNAELKVVIVPLDRQPQVLASAVAEKSEESASVLGPDLGNKLLKSVKEMNSGKVARSTAIAERSSVGAVRRRK